MPSPTVCTVTGTCRDLAGAALAGVIVRATNLKPFIHPTDSSLVLPYSVSTTSANDGTWSLNLVETASATLSTTISLTYATGSTLPNDTHDYTVTVPNSASATFASLITGEP